MLNDCLYVDDLTNIQPDIDSALAMNAENFEMFQEANVIFRKWKTNFSELYEKWKSLRLPVDEMRII